MKTLADVLTGHRRDARGRPLETTDRPGTRVATRYSDYDGELLGQSFGYAWVQWPGESVPHTVPVSRLWVREGGREA